MLKRFRAPKFWNDNQNILCKCLNPIAKLYSMISTIRRNAVTPEQVSIPVVCIGNVVIGGAGKTPTVSLVCEMLKEQGYNPHILTASYGGYLNNVVQVDSSLHSYLQVGDEPLLLTQVAPTWIGKNRVNASKAAVLAGADILIMDDGFQNNSLVKNYKILVIDSGQQFGNGCLFPAGPLIEPIDIGIKASDVVLIIGNRNEDLEIKIKSIKNDISICRATMEAVDQVEVENNRVVGFCGLGYPLKFKKTLIQCGYNLIDFISFSDHHPYTITEIQKLIKKAKDVEATLVTTMKDYIKIPEVFRSSITVIKIKLQPENSDFKDLLLKNINQTKSIMQQP